MSANTSRPDLTERVKLGVPTNDVEAIAMLMTACDRFENEYATEALVADATTDQLISAQASDHGRTIGQYVYARRFMKMADAYELAIRSMYITRDSDRYYAYLAWLDNGGEF